VFPVDTVTFTENDETKYPSSSGPFAGVFCRHDRRANLGFADGHAGPVPYVDCYRVAPGEDSSAAEFSKPRKVYWWPYPGAQP
jgi:prepilin-type processing-associated H-X9-DG protein